MNNLKSSPSPVSTLFLCDFETHSPKRRILFPHHWILNSSMWLMNVSRYDINRCLKRCFLVLVALWHLCQHHENMSRLHLLRIKASWIRVKLSQSFLLNQPRSANTEPTLRYMGKLTWDQKNLPHQHKSLAHRLLISINAEQNHF